MAMTQMDSAPSTWAYGCDYAWAPHPTIDALKAVGIKFVCRYLSTDVSKNISADEKGSLEAAGIAIVLNWEVAADAMALGRGQGVSDAAEAKTQAEALGMGNAPIYFSADFDANDAEISACVAYMEGVVSVIGLARAGVYGDQQVTTACKDAGVCTFTWGTPAWGGDPAGWHVNIYQYENDAQIGGVAVDLDAGYGTDWGQWPRPDEPTPTPGPVWPTIQSGDTGQKVRTIQWLLNNNGAGLAIDGIYGANTLAAVRAFQSIGGLSVDGIVGPNTWAALTVTVRLGDTGGAVHAVQQVLHAIQDSALATDGDFGPDTLEAVRLFQSNHKLTVDGVVGPVTWNALVWAE
jgi:Domain of unknown function (DUF1906)/Putative peptidoglycan binding domain